jgi:predicted membrane chloride channel (bestrophin family)
MKKQTPNPKPPKRSNAKTYSKKRFHERVFESDSAYFLKLVVMVLLGTFWIKFATPVTWLGISIPALPLGILIGFLVVRAFEHHQEDRKIWYAVLLVIGVISYFVPAGIVV